MGYSLPDPRMENPGMLLPNGKPPGPLAIDWDNPIAEGLIVSIALNNYQVDELVSHRPVTIYGDSPMQAVGNRLQARGNAFANDRSIMIPSTATLNTDLAVPQLSWFTVAAARTDGIFNKHVVSYGGNASGIRLRIDTSAVDKAYIEAVGTSANRTIDLGASTFAVLSEPNSYAATSNGDDLDGYFNGELIGSASGLGSISYRQSFEEADGVVIGGSAPATRPGDFDVDLFHAWSRKLSASEVRSLHANPLQLWVPA